MISRRTRLRYSPYALVGLGLVAVWYGATGPALSFVLIGVATVLGACYVVLSGYTPTGFAVMGCGVAVSAALAAVLSLVSEGVTIWVLCYLLIAVAGGRRGSQYWRARSVTPEDRRASVK